MKSSRLVSALAVVLAMTGGARAQDIIKDLQTVIALQGKPCGEVTEAERQGPDDYIASCSNGIRYRVMVDENGRVVITEL